MADTFCPAQDDLRSPGRGSRDLQDILKLAAQKQLNFLPRAKLIKFSAGWLKRYYKELRNTYKITPGSVKTMTTLKGQCDEIFFSGVIDIVKTAGRSCHRTKNIFFWGGGAKFYRFV
jgi:hypothetical protein